MLEVYNEDDHITPRALGEIELWAAWDRFDKLSPDVLYGIDDYSLPEYYSTIRLTYDRISPAVSADLHALRLAKMSIWEAMEKETIPNDASGFMDMFLKMSHQSIRAQGLEMDLLDKLNWVEKKREGANILYREGRFHDAMIDYAKAWKDILPYHVDALAPTDPHRARLGYLEAVLFANMAATCIALSKLANSRKGELKYLKMAFQCAWVTFELRELAAATTLRNALHRAHDTLKTLFVRPQSSSQLYVKLSEYYAAQTKALENVSRDVMFKDLDEALKVRPPDRDALQSFGPRSWAHKWIDNLPAVIRRPPPIQSLKHRRLSRDLTPFELWAGWDELPEELRHDIFTNEPVTVHPQVRINYALLPKSRRSEMHHLRSAKFSIFRTIMSSAAGDKEFKHILGLIREKPVDKPDLNDKLREAEKKKAQANKIYRRGEYLKSTAEYFFAFSMILPYHTAALDPGDPLCARLGKFESALWCNLSASIIAVSKDPGDDEARDGFKDMAYKCAWASFEERDWATVSTVKNACLRAKDNFASRFSGGGPEFHADVAAFKSFFTTQADELSRYPRDMMYADVPEAAKTRLPDKKLMDQFGPSQWALEHGMMEWRKDAIL